MILRVRIILGGLIITMCLFSCSHNDRKQQGNISPDSARVVLQRINKVLVKEDREQIEEYIKRHRLEGMKESKTGLYYLIYGNSNGTTVKRGNLVEYSYKVTLLDGTVCYQSKPDSLGNFVVGHGGVESGLEQGILMMKQGQKAKFIMPPHLAHGLIGDASHIPARAIIVYDLELLKVYP